MKKNLNKTCKGCVAELKCNTTFIRSFFVEGRNYKMYILILLGVAMLSSILTLAVGVRIDIWTHFMRECIINYVH